MYKLFFIYFFLILFVETIIGQTTYSKGYIITNELDTVFGLIDNKDYYYNARFCDFKENNSSVKTRYYPGQISGYRFQDGKFYLSKDISLNDKDSTFFMEYLVDGELDLYFIQSENNRNHFYASKDNEQLRELKYFKGIIKKGSRMYERSRWSMSVL